MNFYLPDVERSLKIRLFLKESNQSLAALNHCVLWQVMAAAFVEDE